jgi:hypothetical protein
VAARPCREQEAMMVRLPDAAGQVRNAPVKVLRAIFAGIGQLLLAADRFRAEDAAHEQPAGAEQQDPLSSPGRHHGEHRARESGHTPERATFRTLESTGNVRILPRAEKKGRSPSASRQTPKARQRPEDPATSPSLPVPGYDNLTLPSLRSRLRSLDAAQLRLLVSYERAHARRRDVVTMFERRIAKLQALEVNQAPAREGVKEAGVKKAGVKAVRPDAS